MDSGAFSKKSLAHMWSAHVQHNYNINYKFSTYKFLRKTLQSGRRVHMYFSVAIAIKAVMSFDA